MSFYKKNCSQLQEAELHFQEHNFHMKCTFFLEKKRRFFNICLCFCIKNPIIVKRTFQTVQCSCSPTNFSFQLEYPLGGGVQVRGDFVGENIEDLQF